MMNGVVAGLQIAREEDERLLAYVMALSASEAEQASRKQSFGGIDIVLHDPGQHRGGSGRGRGRGGRRGGQRK